MNRTQRPLNYERDIYINADALDIEWLEQSELMLRYGRHEADTQRNLDLAKEKLDLIKAELD